MQFKDCQDMAEQIRAALKTFTDDAVGTVIASQTKDPVTPDFQPLYDILSETHTTLLAAQDKLTSAKAGKTSFDLSVSDTPGILSATPGVPVGSVAISTLPLVIDGPVLPV